MTNDLTAGHCFGSKQNDSGSLDPADAHFGTLLRRVCRVAHAQTACLRCLRRGESTAKRLSSHLAC